MTNNNRRGGGNNAVRGPTSALSSFLRERGITVPTNPYQRIERNGNSEENLPIPPLTAPEIEIEQVEVNSSENAQTNTGQAPEFPKKKSDDEEPKRSRNSKRKLFNEDYLDLIKNCQNCKRKFINSSNATICHACISVGAKESKVTKKARRKAEGVVLEVTGKLQGLLLPLKDICIRVISEHIDNVEELGFMEQETKTKLSRIVSKRRKLSAKNLALFLGVDEVQVRLFDCTRLNSMSLAQIPLECPNLRILELGFCGQMTDHVLNLISTNCPSLVELKLHGAFLCTDEGWSQLFQNLGSLESLSLIFAVKFSNFAISSLLDNCPLLKKFHLTDCPNLKNEGIAKLADFDFIESLSLNFVGSLDNMTLCKVLHKQKDILKELSLNQNPNINSEILPEIGNCKKLSSLSLQGCPGLVEDDSQFIKMMSELSNLEFLDLSGNNEINDDMIISCLNNHGDTLKYLSLNGLNELTERSLLLVSRNLPVVENLNISWVRYFSDALLMELLQNSTSLELLKLFGCNQLTSDMLDKEWMNKRNERIILLGNEFD